MASSLTLHRGLGTFDRVSLYLAVSEFLRDKYIQAGIPKDRIVVKPNFVHCVPRRQGPGEYFLFLGRLSPEKGISTLLEAWRPTFPRLVIAGEGSERALLQDGNGFVDYLGNLAADELPKLLAGARAVLLPSRWYEGAPRVILEAYAAGVPVVGSRIGGLPSLIEDGESGLLVPLDDVGAWASALERLSVDTQSERMGERAWRLWEERFSPVRGLENLEAAYKRSLLADSPTNGSKTVGPPKTSSFRRRRPGGSKRVLILHSRYLSGQTSGENRVAEDEAELLSEAGHDVQLWSPSPSDLSTLGLARLGVGAVWSRAAVKEVRRLVRRQRTEIVHCHNLFPMLSPAVLSAAAAEGASVVMTLHSYRLFCLPSTFLRDGRICEDCLGHIPWRGVMHRCYRGSTLGSSALAGSLTLHRGLKTFDRVSLYLAVSDFLRDKYIQAGIPKERIAVKPNFVHSVPRRQGPGEYFLFLGRLSPEKGLSTLLEAWPQTSGLLVVAGQGPELERLPEDSSVEYRGNLAPADLSALLGRARALLVPSQSYEGAPRVVLEAYAAGVPVVGSRIGGLPSLIEDGESGLLVPPSDAAAWAAAVRRLMIDEEVERLGERAWQLWNEHYSPTRGLQNLEAAYAVSLESVS